MNEFITIAQARDRYGIARTKMTALIQSGAIPVYDNPRDKRSQLVKPSDVEAALQPPQGKPKTRKKEVKP